MKKILQTLTLLMCFLTQSIRAEEIGGIEFEAVILEDGTYEVWVCPLQNGKKYKGKVIIPETINILDELLTVTTIGFEAFSDCTELTSVVMPNTIKCIESGAFSGCTGLTSVSIPESVTNIEASTFAGCTGLTSVYIPKSVTHIGRTAFGGCTGLTSIDIPSSVTSIGQGAFSSSGLEIVNIPNSVLSIGSGTFCNCTSLTSVFIGSSIKNLDGDCEIGTKHGVFENCAKLASVNISNVEKIGFHAFMGCKSLASIAIPNSVTSIDESAFYQCTSLASITIPNSVTTIGNSAFLGCTDLTAIDIPNSVTSIGNGAFAGCTGLTSVTIPNSVTTIDHDAFRNCTGLTEIVSLIKKPFDTGWCWENVIRENVTLYVPIGTKELYKRTSGWNYFSKIFERGDDVAEPDPSLIFTYDDNTMTATLTNGKGTTGEVVIPAAVKHNGKVYSVTSIGNMAFKECTALTSVTFTSPNSLTTIGSNAFRGCTGLTSIEIPKFVKNIGNGTFSGCLGLTSIKVDSENSTYDSREDCNAIIKTTNNMLIAGCKKTIIPNSVTSISDEAFYGCTGLTAITIPNSVKSISAWAFFGCSGLSSIVVDPQNKVYNSKENCNAIIESSTKKLIAGCQNTIIPNSVTSIGDCAFSRRIGLTSITIPNSVTNIGSDAFLGCTGLTAITIPNSVKSIEPSAFNNCTSLVSLEISNSVTSIGSYAFAGCSDLTSVTIPNSVTTIGNGAFESCKGLTSVSIPKSVTSIGSYAFGACIGLTEIVCLIEKPFAPGNNCWYKVSKGTPLYVPKGTKELYEATTGWHEFTNIIERGLEPIDRDEQVTYDSNGEFNGGMDLEETVIDDIYYNIPADAGGYNADEGCITLQVSTTDEQVEEIAGKDVFDATVKGNFKGIAFLVPAGSGTITINAETTGGMTLKVKVGDNEPVTKTLNGKQTVVIPYSTPTSAYVYIYAGGTAAAKSMYPTAATESALKIYGITLGTDNTTDINSIQSPLSTVHSYNNAVYDLQGHKVSPLPTSPQGGGASPLTHYLSPLKPGIYIVNGKKIAVK